MHLCLVSFSFHKVAVLIFQYLIPISFLFRSDDLIQIFISIRLLVLGFQLVCNRLMQTSFTYFFNDFFFPFLSNYLSFTSLISGTATCGNCCNLAFSIPNYIVNSAFKMLNYSVKFFLMLNHSLIELFLPSPDVNSMSLHQNLFSSSLRSDKKKKNLLNPTMVLPNHFSFLSSTK